MKSPYQPKVGDIITIKGKTGYYQVESFETNEIVTEYDLEQSYSVAKYGYKVGQLHPRTRVKCKKLTNVAGKLQNYSCLTKYRLHNAALFNCVSAKRKIQLTIESLKVLLEMCNGQS